MIPSIGIDSNPNFLLKQKKTRKFSEGPSLISVTHPVSRLPCSTWKVSVGLSIHLSHGRQWTQGNWRHAKHDLNHINKQQGFIEDEGELCPPSVFLYQHIMHDTMMDTDAKRQEGEKKWERRNEGYLHAERAKCLPEQPNSASDRPYLPDCLFHT